MVLPPEGRAKTSRSMQDQSCAAAAKHGSPPRRGLRLRGGASTGLFKIEAGAGLDRVATAHLIAVTGVGLTGRAVEAACRPGTASRNRGSGATACRSPTAVRAPVSARTE